MRWARPPWPRPARLAEPRGPVTPARQRRCQTRSRGSHQPARRRRSSPSASPRRQHLARTWRTSRWRAAIATPGGVTAVNRVSNLLPDGRRPPNVAMSRRGSRAGEAQRRPMLVITPDGGHMELPSLTRIEADERAKLISVSRLRHRRRPHRPRRGHRRALPSPRSRSPAGAGREHLRRLLRRRGDRDAQRRAARAADRRRPDRADRPARRQRARASRPSSPRPPDGEGVHRAVDPTDGEVYVWTSFEPDEARRVWACFDQPDLKAPHAFTVTAPARLDRGQQQRRLRVEDRRRRAPLDLPRHTATLDVQPGRQRRAASTRCADAATVTTSGLLSPPFARRGARPRRRRDLHRDRAGPGLLRRALRDAVPAA